MTVAAITAVAVAVLVTGSTLAAQERGPTVAAARAAFSPPSAAGGEHAGGIVPRAPCRSALKNGALLGLGLSLAAATIELTYTIVREPFVRNGHDLPAANPTLIAWAGGAGFIVGLVGTELCRRRRR